MTIQVSFKFLKIVVERKTRRRKGEENIRIELTVNST